VPATLLPHRGQDFLRESVLLARGEPCVKGGCQHVGGDRFFHGRLHGPAPLTGVLHEAGVIGQGRGPSAILGFVGVFL
jgi:hypothetical protein